MGHPGPVGCRHKKRCTFWSEQPLVAIPYIPICPYFRYPQIKHTRSVGPIHDNQRMLGDDLVALPPERRELALLSSLTDLRGGQWTPQSPLQFVSGLDAGPVIELITGDDRVPTRWDLGDEATVLLNLGDEPVVVGSPGGTELISGLVAGPGDRTLPAGSGEVWVP